MRKNRQPIDDLIDALVWLRRRAARKRGLTPQKSRHDR